MWLINCQTLDLEYVVNHQDTKYAILSHTWEAAEEVQFEEFQNAKATEKRGWQKIRNGVSAGAERWLQFCVG